MTGIVVRSPSDVREFVKLVSKSQNLPSHLKSDFDVGLSVSYAVDLGLPPTVGIKGVHIVNGKPELSAALMLGLIKRAGYSIRWNEADRDTIAELSVWDPGHTKDAPPDHVERFTIENAVRAELTTGKNAHTWKKYPDKMLRSRCVSAVMRGYCAEVALGDVYAEGEISDEVHVSHREPQQTHRADVVDADFEEVGEVEPVTLPDYFEGNFAALVALGRRVQSGEENLSDIDSDEVSARDEALCAWLKTHVADFATLDDAARREAWDRMKLAAASAGWTVDTLKEEMAAIRRAQAESNGEEE